MLSTKKHYRMGIDLSTYRTQDVKGVATASKSEKRRFQLNSGFSNKDRLEFYKEFAGLLDAGVDFKQALTILKEQQKKKIGKDIIEEVGQKVVKGSSLFEALKSTDKFSPYEYYGIKIGEETRRLSVVLKELSIFYENKIKTKRQLVSVFTYPAFVFMLTIGVLVFMLKFVVPMFASIFNQFGKELPPLTKKIISLSDNFPMVTLIVVLPLVALIAVNVFFGKNDKYRALKSKVVLAIPFVGKLMHKIYTVRLCQSLSLLLNAKTPLIISLQLVREMIDFFPYKKALDAVKSDIEKGFLLSDAMKKHTIFDYKLISMVSIGEQVNELGEIFGRLAKQYDEEAQHQTKLIGVVIEPLIIIIIGSIVGVVLIAMYSPMFDLSKILQS